MNQPMKGATMKKLLLVLTVLTFGVGMTFGATVTFNVNMAFQIDLGNFDPASDFVDVAGSLNGWGGSEHFTDADGDSVYSLTVDSVAVGTIEYKFRMNADWGTSEGDPNRSYDVVDGVNDIPVDWYNRQEPVAATNVEVLLQVDMNVQLLNGNFDPNNGDLIVVRGAPSQYGGWGGAIEMTEDAGTAGVYNIINQFDNVPVGSAVEYKFVILTGGDPNAAIWEGSPNRSWTPTGQEEDTNSNGYGEITQPVEYFADITPDDIIMQDVTVTFSVDISSVFRALDAGDTLIDTQTGSDDIVAWSEVNGVCINGILGQWWDWGIDTDCTGEWAMTYTDTFKYSYDYLFTAGQAKDQQYKYGVNSLDNEAGFGNNRHVIIDDAAATFAAPEDCFGENNTDTNLPFPQLCAPLAVENMPGIPTEYTLDQNYPNPFNPSTAINFSIAQNGAVKLTVYNVLGQEVRTLVNSVRNTGNYRVEWDATNNNGEKVNSGLYIYRLEAGNKMLTNKMVLMK